MKLNKIIYDIRESLNQSTDDSYLSDEYISYLIGVYRAEILKNELNNFQRTTNPVNTQSFSLEVEEVSKYDCNIDVDCETILRTKQPIPSPIKMHTGSSLTMVRPTDITSKPFVPFDQSRIQYIMNSKFSRSIYYFLGSDLHLYFIGKDDAYKLMKCVNISGVFADPLDLENYKKCCDCTGVENICFDILAVNL